VDFSTLASVFTLPALAAATGALAASTGEAAGAGVCAKAAVANRPTIRVAMVFFMRILRNKLII
jgi:hypothetical protein